MAITLSFIPICGPEINVRFPRVVMPSKLYLFAMHGDINGVKTLFTEGAASPWDVNERGSSALYVSHTDFTLASFPVLWRPFDIYVISSDLLNDAQFAAISGDVGLCRFLIEQGADPVFENQYHTYVGSDVLAMCVD